jgi:hypothetical protein
MSNVEHLVQLPFAQCFRNGIPLFLEQLRRTLEAEDGGEAAESLKISGASGGDCSCSTRKWELVLQVRRF